MCMRSLLGQVINPKHVQNKTTASTFNLHLCITQANKTNGNISPCFHGVWITKIWDDKVLLLVVKKVLHEKQGLVDSWDSLMKRRAEEKRPQNVGRQRCCTSHPPVIHSGTKTCGQNQTEALSTNGEEREKSWKKNSQGGPEEPALFWANCSDGGARMRGRPTPCQSDRHGSTPPSPGTQTPGNHRQAGRFGGKTVKVTDVRHLLVKTERATHAPPLR